MRNHRLRGQRPHIDLPAAACVSQLHHPLLWLLDRKLSGTSELSCADEKL